MQYDFHIDVLYNIYYFSNPHQDDLFKDEYIMLGHILVRNNKVSRANCKIIITESDLAEFSPDLNYNLIYDYLKGEFNKINRLSKRELNKYIGTLNNNIQIRKDDTLYGYGD